LNIELLDRYCVDIPASFADRFVVDTYEVAMFHPLAAELCFVAALPISYIGMLQSGHTMVRNSIDFSMKDCGTEFNQTLSTSIVVAKGDLLHLW